MKKQILFFALTIAAIVSMAQVKIEPPISLYFGQTSESASLFVVNKGGVFYENEMFTSNCKAIYHTDVNIGTETYFMISNYYHYNKLVKTVLGTQVYESWYSVSKKYFALKETFTSKYGEPVTEVETFYSPYYEGDGYERNAFYLEKAAYLTSWQDSYDNYLMISISAISTGMFISIYYESSSFTKFSDEIKNAESNDL